MSSKNLYVPVPKEELTSHNFATKRLSNRLKDNINISIKPTDLMNSKINVVLYTSLDLTEAFDTLCTLFGLVLHV